MREWNRGRERVKERERGGGGDGERGDKAKMGD